VNGGEEGGSPWKRGAFGRRSVTVREKKGVVLESSGGREKGGQLLGVRGKEGPSEIRKVKKKTAKRMEVREGRFLTWGASENFNLEKNGKKLGDKGPD